MTSARLSLDPPDALAALRITTALSLLHYNLLVVAPEFDALFGAGSMVAPSQFVAFLRSPLFWVWESPVWLRTLFALYLLSLAALAVGLVARAAVFVALPLAIAFHHANPMILHEPQQLSILLLWVLLFVPIEQRWALRPTASLRALERGGLPFQRAACGLLLAYLSAYYFFAGLKKLPDPAWLDGRALFELAQWNALRADGFLAESLRTNPILASVGTYVALAFELGFPLVALTRIRWVLAPMGLAFHAAIQSAMDVGHFATVMFAWYPVLLVGFGNETRAR